MNYTRTLLDNEAAQHEIVQGILVFAWTNSYDFIDIDSVEGFLWESIYDSCKIYLKYSKKDSKSKNPYSDALVNYVESLSRPTLGTPKINIEIEVRQTEETCGIFDRTYVTESGQLLSPQSRYRSALKELEMLVQNPHVKEQELQTFFETYNWLLSNDEYEHIISQAIIVKDDLKIWKADFILAPLDQASFSKIIELKLPSKKICLKTNSGHINYSSQLQKSIQQLKDYKHAFNAEITRSKFKEKYKIEIFEPDLQLIFGRRNGIENFNHFKQLQNNNNLKIIDWDSLLAQLKAKYC